MLTNHYGVTVDSEEPTTGVFQNNRVDWLGDEMAGGTDLDYLSAYDDVVADRISKIQNLIDGYDHCHDYSRLQALVLDLDGDVPELDCLESNQSIIGFHQVKVKEDAWHWFDNLGYGYAPDPEAEYSAIIGEVYTQVVKSKWAIKGALCSPCYPGQVDVDTEGEFLGYSFPPDIFEDKPEFTSRIYRIKEERPK